MTTSASDAGVPSGEVFDLGYRGYDGPREGIWRSRKALWRDGLRASLGLGRSTGQKVAPFGLIALAMIPAVVIVVLRSFASTFGGDPDDFEIPSFAEYYDFAWVPLLLMAAIQAPELLCPDRRQRVVALYFVRPLQRYDYVAARWTAFAVLALFMVWLPQVVFFIWSALDASDPGDWITDNWDIVPRFLGAGAAIALLFTTLAMFAASFTSRRAYAALIALAVVFIGAAVAGIAEENLNGTLGDALSLTSVVDSVLAVSFWAFDEPLESPLPGWAYTIWVIGLTLAMGTGLLWRYRRLSL